jgi:putative FmdB family regulatory protein
LPIYEYRCKSCGKVIEVIQQFSDRPLRKCRTCSGKLEKLISSAAFHLKGGGWYAEGYNKNASKKSGSSDDKASSSGDSKCAASGTDS